MISCNFLVQQVDGCSEGERDIATLYDFTSYANGIHGLELSVVGHVRLVGFKVADNVDNGIEIQETHGWWGGPMIQVCSYVCLSVCLFLCPSTYLLALQSMYTYHIP